MKLTLTLALILAATAAHAGPPTTPQAPVPAPVIIPSTPAPTVVQTFLGGY